MAATQVYKTEDVSLQDGTDVTLKPLAIGRLRTFMEAWSHFAESTSDDEGFDVFINCAGIALEHNFTDVFDSLRATAVEKKKGSFLSTEYKTYLEDTLDLDTIYMVLDLCGGIKLNDPKLMEAAMAAAAVQDIQETE